MKKIVLPLLGILLLAACEKDAVSPVTTGEDSTLDLRATEKLIVCHNTGSETPHYEMIEIAEPAYERAHLDHGDARPGEVIPEMPGYRFGCNCEVEPAETACLPDGKTWTTANLSLEPDGYVEGEDFWWYDNDAAYAAYGRLYTWDAAKKACQDLGSGWRLPTKNDWDGLIRAYDDTWPSTGTAYSVPALASLLGNNSPSGFDASLAGGRFTYFPNGPFFDYLGQYGYYWSSTEYTYADYYFSYYFDDVEYNEVSRGYNRGSFGFSCRCVKD